jgi:hypothetical protein
MMSKAELEKFLVEKIYVTPTQAARELEKRRANKELLREVMKFLEGKLPTTLQKSPKAVLARVLATPNFEYLEFLRLAQEAKMEPWCLEYTEDKFRAENFDKYYLGKLFFNYGIGKKGGEKLSAKKVIDFDAAEGKLIKNIETLWGENFVDFHHRLVCSVLPDGGHFEDASWWIDENGKKSSLFYPYYLALFLCHGVLFENFLLEDKPLIEDMFLPAVSTIFEKFQLYPLVVPLSCIEQEYDIHWRHYPSEVEGHCESILVE